MLEIVQKLNLSENDDWRIIQYNNEKPIKVSKKWFIELYKKLDKISI